MKVSTTRFGEVKIEADDILLFRGGLIGFEDLQHWVVLADGDNDAVAWLQSMARPEIALPVISPRRFVSGYQVHVEGRDIDGLQLTASDQAYVLSVVSSNEHSLTANLRAPIVINLDRRLGCQVITSDDQSLQHEILPLPVHLRRTA